MKQRPMGRHKIAGGGKVLLLQGRFEQERQRARLADCLRALGIAWHG